MADDMASNGAIFDAQARYAALDERVTNLRTSMVNLEGEMRSGFTTLNSHLSSISTEMRAGQKTAWPVIWSAIGVSFAILVAVGSQALSPVRETVSDVKEQIGKMITREELDARSARSAEDRARIEAALIDLRTTMVTRNEWMERNGSRDHQIESIEREISDLKAASAATYNVRDVILDLRERLDRLEHDRTRPLQ